MRRLYVSELSTDLTIMPIKLVRSDLEYVSYHLSYTPFSGQFVTFYSSVLGATTFKFYLLDVTDKIKYLLGKTLNSNLFYGGHTKMINIFYEH